MIQPVHLAALAVFSSLSVNLLLQCGLGMRRIIREGEKPLPFAQMGLLVLAVLVLWVFFSYLPALGFFTYLLLFPLSSLVYAGLEELFFRLTLKRTFPRPQTCCSFDGLTAAALFLSLHLASGFVEAAVLALGFALGLLLSLLILAEIRRRALMEAVPRFLQGSPLTLISMGLLSLIFSSAALMFYHALGG
jgi:electron transport complex protein RnfA